MRSRGAGIVSGEAFFLFVMPALAAGIHVFLFGSTKKKKNVDGRSKSGHDEKESRPPIPSFSRLSRA
jgi:hypothetical protein